MTVGAGVDNLDKAFVVYIPNGQIMWALVDGAGQSSVTIQFGGQQFDLLA